MSTADKTNMTEGPSSNPPYKVSSSNKTVIQQVTPGFKTGGDRTVAKRRKTDNTTIEEKPHSLIRGPKNGASEA